MISWLIRYDKWIFKWNHALHIFPKPKMVDKLLFKTPIFIHRLTASKIDTKIIVTKRIICKVLFLIFSWRQTEKMRLLKKETAKKMIHWIMPSFPKVQAWMKLTIEIINTIKALEDFAFKDDNPNSFRVGVRKGLPPRPKPPIIPAPKPPAASMNEWFWIFSS